MANADQLDLDVDVDTIDRCPGIFDPQQDDADGDGVGDLCDVCPTEADPAAGESRWRRLRSELRLRRHEPDVWSLPSDIEITFQPDQGMPALSWGPPADRGTDLWGLTYHVLESPAPSNWTSAATCTVLYNAPEVAPTEPYNYILPDGPGMIFYLVVVENACGAGSAGYEEDGTPRVARDCP